MIENIPLELIKRPQWVIASPSKVPISPKTGGPASVTRSDSWASFEEAKAALTDAKPLIGFVLTDDDPYTIIDLDEPKSEANASAHRSICTTFADTYQETSQSGRGMHIVCRGAVKSFRRNQVEVYSTKRYMIFTGQSNGLPIIDKQMALDALAVNLDEDEAQSDQALLYMASAAKNGDKFNRLCAGNWEGSYPSQSEADQALISILCFYTDDDQQVIRIFQHDRTRRKRQVRQG